MKDKLNVLFASDDNYVPFLLISIVSLLENENNFENINIFILDDGISKEHKGEIVNLVKRYFAQITFIKTKDIKKMDFNVLSLERNYNLKSFTTYSRLFISHLLPEDVDKILYLDCDSIILGSFKDLWVEDISNYYCAGILDCINTAVKESLGIPKDDIYINAGVLLINLKKWRDDNVEDKFVNFLIKNQNRFYQHDQGVINLVFKNKIKIVEPKYNLQVYFQLLDYDLAKKFACIETEYYTKEIVFNSQKNPIFLHFCGENYFRPWYNCNHPYFSDFKKYSQLVDSEYIIDDSANLPFKSRIFFKVSNNKLGLSLLKLIPSCFVRRLVNRNALNALKKENEKIKMLE